ncbi:threonine aldolase family protein [Desulfovibrio oxyclinae]|uniref:threonine aldolase family protein n=1 Tax=Desulfovibrio oxyclinae TaxID=63560 RepID=UPI000372A52B|nr:low specificity L-threonine aldolase [Desulfovibrio oxyclinae]
MKSFASDNNSGAHPAVLHALTAADAGSAKAYGEDETTRRAEQLFREHFGPQARTFFVTTGTAANVTGLRSVCETWQSVICSEHAHITTDECGAPEAVGGFKSVTLPSNDGRISPDQAVPQLAAHGFVHRNQPRVISLTQCTELGTLYRADEIRAWCDFAHKNDMLVHIDGARIANACAALGCSFREMTTDLGVDLLSFGGTKNGLVMGEAVVLLNPDIGPGMPFFRKQFMQLVSKMRFVSAQFLPYLEDGIWLENARHANAMAKRLAKKAAAVEGVEILGEVETNAVFAKVPEHAINQLLDEYYFYIWDETERSLRWMLSWNTTEAEVDQFAASIKAAVQSKG